MFLKFTIFRGIFATWYFKISQNNQTQAYNIMTYFKPTGIGTENEWFFINHYHKRVKTNYTNIRKTFKELKFKHEH